MEDALRDLYNVEGYKDVKVLILVLMEDALRVGLFEKAMNSQSGLNPCSNGRCSASLSERL